MGQMRVSLVSKKILRELPHRAIYLGSRTLDGVLDLDSDITMISFRYADLVKIDWCPIWRRGKMFLSVTANISIIAPNSRFARRVELGEIQGADVVVGRDLVALSSSSSLRSRSTRPSAATSANVYPLVDTAFIPWSSDVR